MKKVLLSSTVLATSLFGGATLVGSNNVVEYSGYGEKTLKVLDGHEPLNTFGDTDDYTFWYTSNPLEGGEEGTTGVRVVSLNHPTQTSGQSLGEIYSNTINTIESGANPNVKIVTGYQNSQFQYKDIEDTKVYYPLANGDKKWYPYILTTDGVNGNSLHVSNETLGFGWGQWPTDEGGVDAPVNLTQEKGLGYKVVEVDPGNAILHNRLIKFNDWSDISNSEDTYFMYRGNESHIVFTQTQLDLAKDNLTQLIINYIINNYFYFNLDHDNSIFYNKPNDKVKIKITDTEYTLLKNESTGIYEEVASYDGLYAYLVIDESIDYGFWGEQPWVVVTEDRIFENGEINTDFVGSRIGILRDTDLPFAYDKQYIDGLITDGKTEFLDFYDWNRTFGNETVWMLESASTDFNDLNNVLITKFNNEIVEIVNWTKLTDTIYEVDLASGEKLIFDGSDFVAYPTYEEHLIANEDFIRVLNYKGVNHTLVHVNDRNVYIKPKEPRSIRDEFYIYNGVDIETKEKVEIVSNHNNLEDFSSVATIGELLETKGLGENGIGYTIGVSNKEDTKFIEWTQADSVYSGAYYKVNEVNELEDGTHEVNVVLGKDALTNEEITINLHLDEDGNIKPYEIDFTEPPVEEEEIDFDDIIEAVGAQELMDFLAVWFNWESPIDVDEIDMEAEQTLTNDNGESVVVTNATIVHNTTFQRAVYQDASGQQVELQAMVFEDPNSDFTYVVPMPTGGLWNMAANATTTVEKIAAYAIIMMVYLLAILVLALVASGATWIGFRIKRGYY